MKPLLEARAARVALDGSVIVDELTLETRGTRVLALGDAAGLIGALTGKARVVGGALALLGHDVARGEHRRVAGLAPLDPPLYGRFTVEEHLAWHGRLCGHGRGAARTRARAVLERLSLTEGRKRRLSTLSLPAKRALSLAAALMGDPEAMVIENPFSGLDAQATSFLGELVARATEGRAALVWLGDLASAPAALVQEASDVCVMRSGRLVAHAEPAAIFGGAQLFEVAVERGAEALRAELFTRGLELSGGPVHFVLRLPEGRTPSDVLIAAAKTRAVVVGCVPIF